MVSTRSPRDSLPTASRYEILVKIAAGGMATVYVGRSRAGGGITRLFAVKRAHPHLVEDPAFRKMFADEARLASRIHHPNVVAVQDVEELEDELLLVLDYVEGAPLSDMRTALRGIDPRRRVAFTSRVVLDACAGLHAAHELRDDDGRPLRIVHRDISPHNVLVGVDGIARLTDFGIAKRSTHTGGMTTSEGLKGKIPYMAPEYVATGRLDRRADVFGLGVVLWESITGVRLFDGSSEFDTIRLVSECRVRPPSELVGRLPRAIDDVVLGALERSPDDRFPTALALADALERAARESGMLAQHHEVGALVAQVAHETLSARREAMRGNSSRSLAEADTVMAELPSDYVGHDLTSSLGASPDRRPVSNPSWPDVPESRPSAVPGNVTLLAASQQIPVTPAPRSNGIVWGSAAVIVVALGLGAFAGARRFGLVGTTSAPAPVETPFVATSAPAVVSSLPPAPSVQETSSAPPTAVPEPSPTVPEPPAASARRPGTRTPAKPTAGPAHAPPNPYK